MYKSLIRKTRIPVGPFGMIVGTSDPFEKKITLDILEKLYDATKTLSQNAELLKTDVFKDFRFDYAEYIERSNAIPGPAVGFMPCAFLLIAGAFWEASRKTTETNKAICEDLASKFRDLGCIIVKPLGGSGCPIIPSFLVNLEDELERKFWHGAADLSPKYSYVSVIMRYEVGFIQGAGLDFSNEEHFDKLECAMKQFVLEGLNECKSSSIPSEMVWEELDEVFEKLHEKFG